MSDAPTRTPEVSLSHANARTNEYGRNLAVERYLAGDIDVDAFVSHTLTLDDVNQGFDLMHHQDGIRSVIQFA